MKKKWTVKYVLGWIVKILVVDAFFLAIGYVVVKEVLEMYA